MVGLVRMSGFFLSRWGPRNLSTAFCDPGYRHHNAASSALPPIFQHLHDYSKCAHQVNLKEKLFSFRKNYLISAEGRNHIVKSILLLLDPLIYETSKDIANPSFWISQESMPLMSSFLETSCEDHDSYEVFSSLGYASGRF